MNASVKSNLIDLACGIAAFAMFVWLIQIFELQTVYLVIIFCCLALGYLRGERNDVEIAVKVVLLNSANILFAFSIVTGQFQYALITAVSLFGTLTGIHVRRNQPLKIKQFTFLILYFGFFLSFAFITLPKLIRFNRWYTDKELLPDFKLLDLKNDTIYSSTFQNKVLVIDFWTSWCGPCQKSLPKLEEIRKIYSTHPEIKFAVINTGQREIKARALSFIRNTNYDLPYYFDIESKLTNKLKLGGIPVLFLVDKKGVVRLKHGGYDGSNDFKEDLISRIDSLLSE